MDKVYNTTDSTVHINVHHHYHNVHLKVIGYTTMGIMALIFVIFIVWVICRLYKKYQNARLRDMENPDSFFQFGLRPIALRDLSYS